MLCPVPGQGAEGGGGVSLFSRAAIPAGRGGADGGQAPDHAGLQQLSGPDHRPGRGGGGHSRPGALRHRVQRLPVLKRHPGDAPGAGGGAGKVPAQARHRHLRHGVSVQRGHHQRPGGPA